MRDDEDRQVIVGGDEARMPGSRRFVCVDCGATVYLAPSGQRALARTPDADIICVECMVRHIQERPEDVVVQPPTTEQMVEALTAQAHRRRN